MENPLIVGDHPLSGEDGIYESHPPHDHLHDLQPTDAPKAEANRRLHDNSRQRLIELGMSELQIAQLKKQGHAQSRMDIVAPMSFTVIEKLAVEGE